MKVVARTTLEPEIMYKVNLEEIFNFYTKRRVKKNDGFDRYGTNLQSMDLADCTNICKDFGIALPREKIM